MVNEDIMTAIRNALDHGDKLDNVINTLINSGYNRTEVEEASRYFSGSVMNMAPPSTNNLYIQPKKSIFGKPVEKNAGLGYDNSQIPVAIPSPLPNSGSMNTIKNEIVNKPISQTQTSEPVTGELKKIHPPKQNYGKEIFLVITLIILVGILILILLYKDDILNYFSSLKS